MTEQKVVIITGISSGMGLAAAELFNRKGWAVYGGARRVERLTALTDQGIHVQPLDVTDAASNKALVEWVKQDAGRIDVLINNAGYGEYGPLEEVGLDKARQQFEVNLFGAADLTQQIIPTMRAQGSGRIINISSIGGDIYMPLGGWYHATKAAINMFSDVLDLEVEKFGIRSVVVQPGGTQSEWAKTSMANAAKNLNANSPYTNLVTSMTKMLTSGEPKVTAADLAEVFYKAATDRKPKRRYFHSLGDRLVVMIGRRNPRTWRTGLKFVMNRFMK
ncbi:MAG: SDR family NAD(P)-dependent oxidoreductase [Lactobacillaceae bacterium]|jgi:NAD(P)-dependent dehydrogenase (short-subunit alcohol dehydrogenase family)|nr:SDR family NAD(P)-dependent oxidoreductase [Lactobacillaceae bacterium]